MQDFKKVGVYVAHDDDSILGVGGRIIQHLKQGDEVYVVIFTDGRHSHKAVLGIDENPSLQEVKAKREKEIKKAMRILGVNKDRLYFLGLADCECEVWQDAEGVRKQIMEITKKEGPDLIYFHFPDAHPDHRAVSKIMLEALGDLEPRPEAYQFFIWVLVGQSVEELAKEHPEADVSQIPEIPQDAIRINIQEELEFKRKALFEMRSQVDVWPYSNWQVQEKPILEKMIIDFFLRGEEIFVKVS